VSEFFKATYGLLWYRVSQNGHSYATGNLLSTKPHIDLIMGQHGKQIMQVMGLFYIAHLASTVQWFY